MAATMGSRDAAVAEAPGKAARHARIVATVAALSGALAGTSWRSCCGPRAGTSPRPR